MTVVPNSAEMSAVRKKAVERNLEGVEKRAVIRSIKPKRYDLVLVAHFAEVLKY